MTTDNIEALKNWADFGITLSDIVEALYLSTGDTKNAEKVKAFKKFAKSGKEFLDKL